MDGNVNILAVLAATLFSMALGLVWYSPTVFGGRWMRELGMTEADIAEGTMRRGRRFVGGFVVHFVALLCVAYILHGADALRGSAFASVTMALVLISLVAVGNAALWEKKSTAVALISGSYTALFLISGSYIIAYWPW